MKMFCEMFEYDLNYAGSILSKVNFTFQVTVMCRLSGSNYARSAAVRSVTLPALVEVHPSCARNGRLRVAKGKGKDVSGIDLGGD